MSSVRRLQVIYEGKQQEWEATHERLTSLRQARAIETDPEHQFKLDRRIKVIEQELKVTQNELNQIEHQLELLGSNRDKFKSEQVTQASFAQQHRYERTDPNRAANPFLTLLATLLMLAGAALMAAGIFMAAPTFQCGYCLGYFFAGFGIFLIGCLLWFFRKRRN